MFNIECSLKASYTELTKLMLKSIINKKIPQSNDQELFICSSNEPMNFPRTARKHSSRVFLMNSCNNSVQGLVFHNAVRIAPSRGAILLSISKMIARYRSPGNWRCIMLASDSCLVHEASKLRNLLFHDLRLAHY